MSKKAFYGILTTLALTAAPAFAQGTEAVTGGVKWGVVGAAFAIAVAAAAGAFAQGKATAWPAIPALPARSGRWRSSVSL
jgi:hypothetical protein